MRRDYSVTEFPGCGRFSPCVTGFWAARVCVFRSSGWARGSLEASGGMPSRRLRWTPSSIRRPPRHQPARHRRVLRRPPLRAAHRRLPQPARPRHAGSSPPSSATGSPASSTGHRTFPRRASGNSLRPRCGRCASTTIDLYQFHSGTDAQCLNDELWAMLAEQKKAGKLRHLGISIPGKGSELQAREARRLGAEALQVIYNRLDRRPEQLYFPHAQRTTSASWRACRWPAAS